MNKPFDPPPSLAETVDGPFGPARIVDTLDVARLATMYLAANGTDVTGAFQGRDTIARYRCELTGMLFWRPQAIAGDEAFYQALSANHRDYYRETRWEYEPALRLLRPDARLLEVGCGRGYFLRAAERSVAHAEGIELNREAIANKVATSTVHAVPLEEFADAHPASFDVVCTFQVLEHVPDPARYLADCHRLLKPGGLMVFSVPNHDYVIHRDMLDPLDLPPHHMNQFNPQTAARVMEAAGFAFETTKLMPRDPEMPKVSAASRRHRYFRVAYRMAYVILREIFKRAGEPGHTMLAVGRKPTGGSR